MKRERKEAGRGENVRRGLKEGSRRKMSDYSGTDFTWRIRECTEREPVVSEN